MFKKLEETSRQLIFISTAISLVLLVVGFMMLDDSAAYAQGHDFRTLIGGRYPFVLGICLGTVFTVLKVCSIDHSCKKALDMDVTQGKLYSSGQYFFRFLMTAALLLAAIMIKQISFIGTVLAVIALQFAGYLLPVWQKWQKRNPAGSDT